MDYKCVNGHDLCNQMYPGPECPYCEKECNMSTLDDIALKAADDIRTFMMNEESFAFPENRERIAEIIKQVVFLVVKEYHDE